MLLFLSDAKAESNTLRGHLHKVGRRGRRRRRRRVVVRGGEGVVGDDRDAALGILDEGATRLRGTLCIPGIKFKIGSFQNATLLILH